MKSFGIWLGLFCMLCLLVVAGCSKDQEVVDLENEMLGDTVADTTGVPVVTTDSTMDTAVAAMDAAAVPVEEPEPSMPSRPIGSGYEVQVAGCEDAAYAQSLVQRYRERGYEPYVTTATIDGQKYYRVRLGIFETFSEAKAVKAAVEDRYSVAAWIDHAE